MVIFILSEDKLTSLKHKQIFSIANIKLIIRTKMKKKRTNKHKEMHILF
jgi:hypothetical protein